MYKDELERKQRQLIVHSFMYYELNNNLWTDSKYDETARLVEHVKNLELDIWKESKFYYIFKDWDSSTGMNLLNDPHTEGRGVYFWYWYTLASRLLKGVTT